MLLRSIVASLALLSLAGAARAEIKTWDGGAGTNLWSTAANWSPDGVPTAADDVVIDLPGALTIVVSGGNAAASIQCAETLQLTSGTLTVSGDSTCAGLAFTGSATLTGAGDVVVTDSFTWLIGAMTGTGTTIIQPTATMNLAPSNGAQRTLSRTLDLQTSGTLSGSGTIFLGSGGLLRVEPGTTLTVDGPVNVSIASGSPSIVIDGTLVKTGTGSLTVSGVQTKNQGLVEVQSGSVVLSGSGTHTGDFALASGASLKLASSVNTFEATSSITGGTLECAAGGSVFHGPIAVDHLLGAGGTPTLNGSLITPKITLTGGSLTLNSPVTVTTLSMTTNSPTLTGSGTVTVEGALTWIAGSMSGSGATVVEPQATVNLAAPTAAQRTLSRTLSLGADATLAGTGTFYLGTNGLFRVESGVTLTVDAAFNLSVANGSPSIVIDGTLVKSGAGTLTINAGLNTQNNGSVDLLAGAILLNSSGTHSGDFALAPGTLLKLGSQANLFQPSSSVTGGTLEVAAGGNSFQGSIEVDALHCSGGSTTISGSAFTPSISVTSGALTVNVPMTVASVSLSGSSPTLTGSGTMTVTDSFVWAAGVISGSGATTVEPTASATLVAPAGVQRALGRTLHLGAHATLAGSGTFFLSSGGLLRIVSGTTLTLDGAVSFAVASGTPSIVIDGSMVKSGAGTLTINPSVTTQNNGSVEVVAGGLTLNGPGTHIGDFTFAPGTTFKLGSQANLFQPSSSVTGGALELSTGGTSFQGLIDVESITCSGGSTTIAGSALAQSISISSGALTVNVPMTVQSLSLAGSGPTLTGSGTVTVTDNFAWTAGVMSGSGVTVVQPTAAATLVAAPSVQRTLQRELQLRANATLAGNGAFFCGSNGFFLVDTGATLTVDGGVSVALSSGAPTVSVKGELVKTGAGSLVFNSGVKLANTGQLTVAGGTVAVITASQLLQVSGTTLTGGGWTVANGATLAFPASTTIRTVATGASVTLEGSSSVFTAIAPLTTINNGGSVAFLGGRDFAAAPVGGIFTNNGTLALGAASDLDIGGAYAQAGGASLVASFGDVNETPLAVTGTATIGGSLAITHAPGFQPPTPSQMTLLSAASVSGTFASIDTPVGGASTEPPPILYTTSTVLYSVATEAQVDLVASSLTPPANATLAAPLTLSWTLTNAAAGPAQGPWTDRVYLSADAAFGDDIELGSLVYASVLQGNQSVLREATFTVPANAFGPRYLIVRTDATNVIDELNERNNTLVSVTPIEILAPDLIVQAIAAPPTVVEGQATPIEWTIRNAGNAASGGLTSTLRWSADAFADAGDPVLATVTSGGPIAPGTNVLAQTSVTLPIAGAIPLGQGYLLVAADSTNAVTESDEANNLLAQAISVVEPPLPDLLAHSLVVPATVSAGAPVTLTWTTQNNGELATTANWVERFQLLAAPDATTALATIGQPTYATPLPAGASVPHSLTVTIPNSLGQRWLALDVDANNTIVEASGEANNRLVAGPITVVGANLVITAASGPTAAEVLQTISVSYTGANIGEGSSYGGCWFDRLYLSLDGTVDASDVSLGLESRCTSPFVPGAQYVDTIGGAIPAAVLPGSYQLLLVVDSNGSRFESNESDNTTLVGTIEIAPPTTPNLIVTAVAAPTSATIGETLSVTWTDVNAGDEPLAQAWQDRVYLSTDATFGGDVGLAPLAASAPLAPGSSLGRSQTIPVPATPGSYWIFVRTDDAGQVTEWNGEGDNVSLAFGPIEVSYGDLPDLAASGLSTPEVISVGAPIALAWTTTNAGPGNAVGPWLERAVILDAPNAATGSTLGQITTAGPLAAGASIARGVTGTMPEAVGVRWIAVDVDAGSAVVEGSNESNNRFVSAPITVVAADLRPLNGQGPSAGEVLSPVTVTYDVTNEGVGDSYGGCWLDRLYLSTDQTLDVNDTVLANAARCVTPLASGTQYAGAVTGVIPATVTSGSYFLFVAVDANGVRYEADESDNALLIGAIEVASATTPNLVVSGLSVPATATINEPFAVSWTIQNVGQDLLADAWKDRVFLSNDATFGGDVALGAIPSTADLAVGQSAVVGSTITPTAPGQYWVFVRTDDANQIAESQGENDNLSIAAGPIEVGYADAPDLVVGSITAPSEAVATAPMTVSYEVTNQGELPAAGLWRETISLSSDGAIGGDTLVGQFWRTGSVNIGQTVTRTEQVIAPLTLVGTMRLVVRVDSENTIAEIDPAHEANNLSIDDAAVQIGEPPLVDLRIAAVTLPAEGVAGGAIVISWNGTNDGESVTGPSWTDRVYLSQDAVLSSIDFLAGSRVHAGALAAGGTWSDALTTTLPTNLVGSSLYAVVVADAFDLIEEGSGDANNATASPTTILVQPAPKANLVPAITALPTSWVADTTVQIGWSVANVGEIAGSGPWSDGLYLSTDATLSADDTIVRIQQFAGDVEPGASYARAAAVTLPVDYVGGTRYLLVRTDINGAVPQSSQSDDIIASASFELAPTPAGDLIAGGLSTSTATLTFGQPIALAWTDINVGTVAVTETWSDIVLLSKDATAGADDTPCAVIASGGAALAPSATLTRSATPTLPLTNDLTEGSYWILVRADANGAVTEVSETNNVVALGPVTIARPPLPNLTAAITSLPSEIGAGEPFTMGITFTNAGEVDLPGNFFSTLSIDGTPNDLLLQQFITAGPIAAGGSLTINRTVTIPAVDELAVTFRLCADSDAAIVEAVESDNCVNAAPVTVRRPNLSVLSVNAPTSATAGATVSVSYQVTNVGTGAAGGFTTDSIFLSPDAAVGSDRLVGVVSTTQSLPVGQSVQRSTSFVVPNDLEGAYAIVVVADSGATIAESNEADNTLVVASPGITIAAADRPNLVVESASTATSALPGRPFDVTFVVRNIGAAPAAASWIDAAYASTNAQFGAGDPLVGQVISVPPLAPGASVARTITASAPTAPGAYRIFVKSDAQSNVLEETPNGESDNVTLAPETLTVTAVTATIEALVDEVGYGTPMPLVVKTFLEGTPTPAPNIAVKVRTIVRGYPSDTTVTTNASGVAVLSAAQQTGLAGIYQFGAAPVGSTPTVQDQVLVWGISVTPNPGSIQVAEGGGTSGTVTIKNLGDVAVTGLSLIGDGSAAGITVETFLPNGSVLAPSESRTATWMLSTTTTSVSGPVGFLVASDQAPDASATMGVAILPLEPSLVATPSPLVRSMPVGEVTFTTVTVRNLGTAPTGTLDVSLSSAPWLTLVSPSTIPSLEPGEETALTIRLSPDADLTLGAYSAAPFLVVKDPADPSVAVAVNGTFTATSDAFASILVKARNEFSYYGVPPAVRSTRSAMRSSSGWKPAPTSSR